MLDHPGLEMRTNQLNEGAYVFQISSGSRPSSDDETEDDDFPNESRGRPYVPKNVQPTNRATSNHRTSSIRRRSPKGTSSGDSTATPRRVPRRTSFARSRSPAVLRTPTTKSSNRLNSPIGTRTFRRTILRTDVQFQLRFFLTKFVWSFSIDSRKAGEGLILLASLFAASLCVSSHTIPITPYVLNISPQYSLSAGELSCHWRDLSNLKFNILELQILSAASLMYIMWTHSTLLYHHETSKNVQNPKSPLSSLHLRNSETNRRNQVTSLNPNSKSDFGYVWMSVPKNYR